MFKQVKLLFLYTETPLHVGSGSSLGTVDLPIQRERHTALPMIQSSGIKGKLRSAFDNGSNKDSIKVIFGSESSEHAGALAPGDARIILFPVRSLAGVFAWITCPLVINRLKRDLDIVKQQLTCSIPEPEEGQALVVPDNSNIVIDNAVVLEEFSFTATKNDQVQDFASWLANNSLPVRPENDEYKYWRNKLKKDLVIISDSAFTDFCKFSTDVVSRTNIDQATKTVKNGMLWTEENLPADTLLYTPLFACDPRSGNQNTVPAEVINAKAILDFVQTHLTNGHSRLQLGGNETVGRGIVATRIL